MMHSKFRETLYTYFVLESHTKTAEIAQFVCFAFCFSARFATLRDIFLNASRCYFNPVVAMLSMKYL